MSAEVAWLGYCHLSKDGNDFELIAAIWCADRAGFEAILRPEAEALGYRFHWTEEVLPAGPWVARRPQAGGAELARSVHEGNRTALGQPRLLVPVEPDKPAAPEQHHLLQVEHFPDVLPLDLQMGIWPKKNVPQKLENALFSQPAPSASDIELFGAIEAVPQMKTYAVVEATNVPLLPDMLKDSGQPFRCLFKGDAYEELKSVAPYVIELDLHSDLTRRMFTHSGMPADLWERLPVIFIRSRGTLDDIWRHFRKFTRIQDSDGKWFYFRFYETSVMTALMHDGGADPFYRRFLGGNQFIWRDGLRYSSVRTVA